MIFINLVLIKSVKLRTIGYWECFNSEKDLPLELLEYSDEYSDSREITVHGSNYEGRCIIQIW